MCTQTPTLNELLTGNEQIDILIRAAYDCGMQRCNVLLRQKEIDLTVRVLQHLMREQKMPLQAALQVLQIPRKDRPTYIQIFAAREKQRGGGK